MESIVFGGLGTGEASVALSPLVKLWLNAELKMVPFDEPYFGAVFKSWNRNWFRRTDPESPPSKSAFYLSSAAGIRQGCVDGPVKIYT